MQESDTNTDEFSASSIASVPDDVAIERVLAGDVCSFEIIMRRYNQRLFRAARSILKDNDAAEDAVQEAYISAYYKLDRFAPHGSFGAWLTRIVVNEALMIKRKDRKYAKHGEVARADTPESHERLAIVRSDPVQVVANNQLAELIEDAVDQLPEDFRAVVVLRAIHELSVKETAASLDINEATVKTRYHRARKLMQASLSRDLESAAPHAFEFAGRRCDAMVARVMQRLRATR